MMKWTQLSTKENSTWFAREVTLVSVASKVKDSVQTVNLVKKEH